MSIILQVSYKKIWFIHNTYIEASYVWISNIYIIKK